MSFWTAYQQVVGGSPVPVSAAAVGPGRSLPEPASSTAAVSVSLPDFHPLLLSGSALLTAGPGEGGFHRLVSPARFLDAIRRKYPLHSGVIDPKCCIIFPVALDRLRQLLTAGQALVATIAFTTPAMPA